MNKKEDRREETKARVITFRAFQAIFWGVFALGISLMAGDGSVAIHLPFSSFSIATVIFGLIGALLCGHFAKVSIDW